MSSNLPHPDTPASDLRVACYRAARYTAVVAAAFCLAVCVLLVVSLLGSRKADLLETGDVPRLKDELGARPTDEKLKQDIRQFDRQLRQQYFQRQAFMNRGAYLLLGGAVVLVLALKLVSELRKLPPDPLTLPMQDPWRNNSPSRWAVSVMGGALAGVLVVWAILPGPTFRPADVASADGAGLASQGTASGEPSRTGDRGQGTEADASPRPRVAASAALTSTELAARNWPTFRGAEGSGIVNGVSPPVDFNGATGKGIIWKAAVPLPGQNSPINWNDRVFLSGANETQRQVFCFDAASGSLLWQYALPALAPGKAPSVFEDTGHAASTMATDGQRALAIFASGEVVALDFAGKLLWRVSLDAPDSQYGYASSLALYGERLIVQYDQGSSAEQGRSALLALDVTSGKVVWKKSRPVPNAWSSPIVAAASGGTQIITCGNPWVIAYNAADGTELWRANCLDGDVAASPVCVGGVVFVANNDRAKAAAIRTDGRGDVSKTHIAWTAEDGLPDIASPLSDGQFLWLVTSAGMMTCYDARTGHKAWEHDLGTGAHASPVLAGNRVCVMDDSGVMHVLDSGREFKELSKWPLGEAVTASPAFAAGKMYLRGKKNLYCIGNK